MEEHRWSEVTNIEMNQFELTSTEGNVRQYAFAGRAWSENFVIPFRHRWTPAEGTLELAFDCFGRVTSAHTRLR